MIIYIAHERSAIFMEKNIYKKLLAVISSIIVLLTINGCSKSFKMSDLFSDVNISYENEDEDLKTIAKVYNDYFFSSLPILRSEVTNKDFLKETFNAYNVDIDFDQAYVFLANYYRCIMEQFDADQVDDHLYDYVTISKPDEQSYDAEYQFCEHDKIYSLKIYKSQYPTLFCDSIVEKCYNQHARASFIKRFYYKFDKIPGDKHEKDDVSSWDITYELRMKNDTDEIAIVVYNVNDIKKKNNEFNTIRNTKQVQYYKNGVLIKEQNINDNEFNTLTNNIYYIYLCEMSLDQLLDNEEKESKAVLKLIKN
jgi:hypothetical protein